MQDVEIEPNHSTIDGVANVPGITATVSLDESDVEEIAEVALDLKKRWGDDYRRRSIVLASVILHAEKEEAHVSGSE